MIFLQTTGYGYSKRLCEDVVCWFVSKYLPRHKLEIEIIHRGMKRENAWGWCDVAGETYKPRSFLIELDTYMDKKTYATVLLHEMVHIFQFCKDQLKIRASKRYFKGEYIGDLQYFEQPHEIQAHSLEPILYQKYLQDRGLTEP